MNIYVCQIVPVPVSQDIQDKMREYNEQLLKWGETNDIRIVKTPPVFMLGTGNVDEMYLA